MDYLSKLALFGGEVAGAPNLRTLRRSASRRVGTGRLGGLWSTLAGPFRRSIHIRFQYAFGLAVLGLVLMAVITIVTSLSLLNTFESSVKEMRQEMMPIQGLQVSMRKVNHLVYRYAIEGDQSAPLRLEEIGEEVDRQLHQLRKAETHFASIEHAHSEISVFEITRAWQHAKDAAQKAFRLTPGTPEATEALARVHAATEPIYAMSSEIHRISMQDLQKHLKSAQSVGIRAFVAMIGVILGGSVLLIVLGIVVGRSVLQPLAELQGAARKLGKKDFSHRVRLRNTKDELGKLGRAFNIAAATLQRLYRELERRSTHDGLTGALNRTGFDERLSVECASADRHNRSLALLMVDIDFFKRINDNYGHQAGDRALQAVARLLSETTRPGDVVARYGGEEFAIILPETEEDSAMAMAERLRTTIKNACLNCGAGESIGVTVSIGCASRRQHPMIPEDLIKSADTALYRAKDAGRNRVVSTRKLSPTSGAIQQTAAA